MPDNPVFDFLKERQDQTQEVTVPKGTTVCTLGETCEHLVIVESGNLRVYKPAENGRSVTLYHIGPGESCILTAGCILNSAPFPAMAETISDVRGIAVPAGLVKRWIHDSDQWRNYVFRLLAERLEKVVELVNAVAFQRLDQRIAAWLMQNTPEDTLETTHQAIANELGSTREAISRQLKEMEREGLVTLSRGRIRIGDRALLNNLCRKETPGS